MINSRTPIWLGRRAETGGADKSSGMKFDGLEEATVPRSGLRTQLTGQRVRWVDGKTRVWVGKKVIAGRGEGSCVLRFDFLKKTVDVSTGRLDNLKRCLAHDIGKNESMRMKNQ